MDGVDPFLPLTHHGLVNEAHQQCGSDEWRALVRSSILPWALGEVDLGDDVLEVGPGYGGDTYNPLEPATLGTRLQ